MTPQPEQEARKTIDTLLVQAGWQVCAISQERLAASYVLYSGPACSNGRQALDFRVERDARAKKVIATGTDSKAVEVVMFMRAVKSRTFFEQMKGRGVRIMKADDLQGVTPDAKAKDHFVIVDAVGVCEQDKTDSRPMEQKLTVSFEKLMQAVAFGNTEDDALTSTDLHVTERRICKDISVRIS